MIGGPMNERYCVRVTKDHLVFSAAHFITYAGNICERLHGHNYRVQAEVEGALAQLLKGPQRVTASGRTDAGVHALGQVQQALVLNHASTDRGRQLGHRRLGELARDDQPQEGHLRLTQQTEVRTFVCETALLGHAEDARTAYVGILDVIDGIVVRLGFRNIQVEVEMLVVRA